MVFLFSMSCMLLPHIESYAPSFFPFHILWMTAMLLLCFLSHICLPHPSPYVHHTFTSCTLVYIVYYSLVYSLTRLFSIYLTLSNLVKQYKIHTYILQSSGKPELEFQDFEWQLLSNHLKS